MVDEYHVESSRKVCQQCGKQFEVHEEYASALVEIAPDEAHKQGLVRQDFCVDHVPAEAAGRLALWRTRVAPPEEPKKKRLAIDDERMLDVFFRLAEATDPLQLDLRYVIGLMLVRRRRLKLDSTRRRGGESVMLVRKSRSKEQFELLDRRLSDAALASVSMEIGTLLDLVEQGTLEGEPDAG